MHLSEAHTWLTLLAALIPPAVGEGGAELAKVLGILVAATPKVGEAVVVAATGATCVRSLQIAEAAPRDADIVGGVIAVEIAVNSILEVAVVNPYILLVLQCEVILAVDVVSS